MPNTPTIFQLVASQPHLPQLAQQSGFPLVQHGPAAEIAIPEAMGQGNIQGYALPQGLQAYCYRYSVTQPLGIRSYNAPADDCFIMQASLSQATVNKTLGGQAVAMDRNLPSGLFFYGPGLHSEGVAEVGPAYTVFIFVFPRSFFEAYAQAPRLAELLAQPGLVLFEELDLPLEATLKQLAALNAADPMAPMSCHALTLQVAAQFVRKVLAREQAREGEGYKPLHKEDLQALFGIRAAIRQRLDVPPSLEKLADRAAMSPSKLKRSFKQVFGATVYQYYLHARMQAAKEMLEQGGVSVSQAGHQVGYSNLSHFTEAFKKQYGLTPSDFVNGLGVS